MSAGFAGVAGTTPATGGTPSTSVLPEFCPNACKDPELHERRIALDHLRSVRHVAQCGRFPARLLERSQPLLPRVRDLCEDLLQVARQREVLEIGAEQLEASRRRDGGGLVGHLLPQRRARLQQCVQRARGNGSAQGELQRRIQRDLVVLYPIHRERRVHDAIARGDTDLDRNAVGAEHFLSADGNDFGANVDFSDHGRRRPHAVLPGPKHAREPSTRVMQPALELEHGHAGEMSLEQRARDGERDEGENDDDNQVRQAGHETLLCAERVGKRPASTNPEAAAEV